MHKRMKDIHLNMGWMKKLLRINLSTGDATSEPIPDHILSLMIGGKGLAGYYLLKELGPSVNPLNPENMIIIATGPAQGTMSIAGRYTIVTKSPHTGIFMDSHVGGYLGPELKFAGFDLVIISGKANKPSYIQIHDDKVKIVDASHLWGKDIIETTDQIVSEFDEKAHVVAIGPAGENLVHIAATNSDYYRTAARGGVGMVFGSKYLKAVAVRGTGTIAATNSKPVKDIRRDINRRAKQSISNGHQLPKLGTSWLVPIASARDQMPTYNYQQGEWDKAEEIEGSAIESFYHGKIKPKPCYRCTLACSYVIDVDYGWAKGKMIQHPEYESISLLGSNLGISDIETLVRLNHLCNILGMDTISTGSVISWFIECGQKNAVPDAYLDEIITFGDKEGILELVNKIAHKEGVGKVLAGGVRRAAEVFGHPTEEWAVHVRGLELPAWDPRGKLGLGLSYITSNVGGSHLRGWPRTSELPDQSSVPVIDSMIEEQDLKILKDSLIMCHFTHSIDPKLTLEDTANMMAAFTGEELTVEDMRYRAQLIWSLCRLFNSRIWYEKKPRSGDVLPHRLMKDGLPSGIAKGKTSFVSLEDKEAALDYFYEQRRCERDGRLTAEMRKELLEALQLEL